MYPIKKNKAPCVEYIRNDSFQMSWIRHINSLSEIRYSENRSEAKRIRFASRPKIVGPFALIRFRFLEKRIRYSENFRHQVRQFFPKK